MTGTAADRWMSRPLPRRALAIARRVAATYARGASPRRGAVVKRRRSEPVGALMPAFGELQPIVPVYGEAPVPDPVAPVDPGPVSDVQAQQPPVVARREADQ